jgi:hypothetical protein
LLNQNLQTVTKEEAKYDDAERIEEFFQCYLPKV